MSLESQIDDLYRLPLGEFTAARNALARTVKGDLARQVKALTKPTLVPWAVNQLYWHARGVYDRLMAAGDALRAGQLAAIEGKSGQLARTADAHKTALAAAVREAARLALRHGARPGADDLARTLEALSLTPSRRDPAGRLIELVQPAGFEALAGVTPAVVDRDPHDGEAAKEKRRQEEAEARRREREARVKAAEQGLERAKEAEAAARGALDRATKERQRAEAALAALAGD
jgi:hypothetical protein